MKGGKEIYLFDWAGEFFGGDLIAKEIFSSCYSR
jgi:hypothetical protein